MINIIFDFNRTLYDPDREILVPDAKKVLATLWRRGYRLILVARAAPHRQQHIKKLGITKYFYSILIVSEKSKKLFSQYAASKTQSFVVGDRIKKEIALGNALGMTTIWLCRGKFRTERPTNASERPTRTIYRLSRLLTLLP